jgi:hypothetical protein
VIPFFSSDPEQFAFLSVGAHARGVVAIGQHALGVVALGQTARGLIAVGQLACGFIAVGQVSVCFFGGGQLAFCAGKGGAMLGLVGRSAFGLAMLQVFPKYAPSVPKDLLPPVKPAGLVAGECDAGHVRVQITSAGTLELPPELVNMDISLVAAELAKAQAAGHEHGQLGVTFDHHAKQAGYREGGIQRTLHAATLTTWSSKRVFQTENGKRLAPRAVAIRLLLWSAYAALILGVIAVALSLPMPLPGNDSNDNESGDGAE